MRPLQFGFQPEVLLLRLMGCHHASLSLHTELHDLLLQPRAFFLQTSLNLFQFGNSLGLHLLGRLMRRLFLRHPLLQRRDLLISPSVFLIGLSQLAMRPLQFGFQPEVSSFRFLHRNPLRLSFGRQLDNLLL